MELVDLKKWLETADRQDLIDAAELVRKADERKQNEERELLLQVTADFTIVGHFKENEMRVALEYVLFGLAKSGNAFCDNTVRIEGIRVPKSEADALIKDRWWDGFVPKSDDANA